MCDINLYSQQTIDTHENVFCRPDSVYHNLEQLLQRGGGGGADGNSNCVLEHWANCVNDCVALLATTSFTDPTRDFPTEHSL